MGGIETVPGACMTGERDRTLGAGGLVWFRPDRPQHIATEDVSLDFARLDMSARIGSPPTWLCRPASGRPTTLFDDEALQAMTLRYVRALSWARGAPDGPPACSL